MDVREAGKKLIPKILLRIVLHRAGAEREEVDDPGRHPCTLGVVGDEFGLGDAWKVDRRLPSEDVGEFHARYRERTQSCPDLLRSASFVQCFHQAFSFGVPTNLRRAMTAGRHLLCTETCTGVPGRRFPPLGT